LAKGTNTKLALKRDVIILQNLAEIAGQFAGTGTLCPSMAISLDSQSSIPCRSIPSPQINGEG